MPAQLQRQHLGQVRAGLGRARCVGRQPPRLPLHNHQRLTNADPSGQLRTAPAGHLPAQTSDLCTAATLNSSNCPPPPPADSPTLPAAVDSTGKRWARLLRMLGYTHSQSSSGDHARHLSSASASSVPPLPWGRVRMEGAPNTAWETFIHCISSFSTPTPCPKAHSLWVPLKSLGNGSPPCTEAGFRTSASCRGQ